MGEQSGEDAQGFLSLSFQEQVFRFERCSVYESNRLHPGVARNRPEQKQCYSTKSVSALSQNNRSIIGLGASREGDMLRQTA